MRGSVSFSLLLLGSVLAVGCGDGGTSGTGGSGTGGTSTGGSGGAGGSTATAAPLTVDTDKGAVQGTLSGTTRAFLGVPFAAPPTGDLRWKPPAPHAAWKDTFDASTKGRVCTQMASLSNNLDAKSGEDCLTLNVWTPSSPASDKLPVMVWIHGGGFSVGSGSDAAYDGQALSEATGTVVVGINYRLGPLGFLALPGLESEDAAHPSTGGYGLEDQRAALGWVKANIASFSGDPAKVTLFGESAGGISTCAHLVSPQSKGLFQRAIIQSGPCDTGTEKAKAMAQGADFLAAIGCDADADPVACARAKPVEDVMSALPSSLDFFFGSTATWFPVIDGWNLPDVPGKLLAEGKFEKMPVLLGTNADEGSLFLFLAGDAGKVADEAAFQAFAEKLVPGKGAEIVALYPTAKYGSAQAAAQASVGDAGFVCPTRRAARALAKGGADAYLYHFTYVPEGALLPGLGSFHSAEVKLVLGNPQQLIPKPLTDDELTLSAAMMGYWSRHAEAGDPNGKDAFAWPKYDEATDEDIVLDLTISKESGLTKDLCDFWDTIPLSVP